MKGNVPEAHGEVGLLVRLAKVKELLAVRSVDV